MLSAPWVIVLDVAIRRYPCIVGRYPKVIAGLPAGRLATQASTVRSAALSKPNSRTIGTST
eukprot:9064652-Pyramimonas_sp.AAC.1